MARTRAVDEYLTELARLLPSNGRKRRRLLREVEDHIEDAVAAMGPMAEGRAAALALDKLGSPLAMANVAAGAAAIDLTGRVELSQATTLDTSVRCTAGSHTIRWKNGSLVALDHDHDSEVALAALGGPVPFCIEVVRAWRQPYGPALALVPRWLDADAPRPDLLAELHATSSGAWAALSKIRPEASKQGVRETRWHRVVIAALPYELRARFCQGVLRSAERCAHADPAARRALATTTSDLARTAARSVREGPRPTAIVIDADSEPALRTTDEGLALTLPMSWARTVSATGPTTFADRLVLARNRDSVLILDWHPGRRGLVAVARKLSAILGLDNPD
jgi:hypothetical protein